jgi:hypothetical protein
MTMKSEIIRLAIMGCAISGTNAARRWEPPQETLGVNAQLFNAIGPLPTTAPHPALLAERAGTPNATCGYELGMLSESSRIFQPWNSVQRA